MREEGEEDHMWKKIIGGKTLREGVLKAEGTRGRKVEGWHGSELCTPEDLRSVHTCSTHQECSKVLIPGGLFWRQSAGSPGSIWRFCY